MKIVWHLSDRMFINFGNTLAIPEADPGGGPGGQDPPPLFTPLKKKFEGKKRRKRKKKREKKEIEKMRNKG